jgi:hypothetical protein
MPHTGAAEFGTWSGQNPRLRDSDFCVRVETRIVAVRWRVGSLVPPIEFSMFQRTELTDCFTKPKSYCADRSSGIRDQAPTNPTKAPNVFASAASVSSL